MSTFSTCTSSTRPGSPTDGDVLFETDTKNIIIWDGTSWRGYANDGNSIPVISNSFSAEFNGSSDYLDVGQITTLAGASAQTVAFWFKSSTAGNFPDWGFRVGSTNQYGAFETTGGEYWFVVRNGAEGRYVLTASDMPNDTDWHHFVHTFNAGSVAIYIDGVEKTGTQTNPNPSAINGTIGDFYIAKQGNISFFSAGLFDEFAIWDVALDASNAAQLYNLGRPFDLSTDAADYNTSADLTHWYKMGDDASDTGSGGVADGNAIINVENAANNNTNDASVGGGAPTYSSSTPS
jgi:hypothetical protein